MPPASADLDTRFLQRAISLAMRGRGAVEPNPMVGCVLVRNGAVIGEGYHARVGGPHAEPTALADCASRGHQTRGANAYVTLEPCCHLNKRTPPCVPALIAAGISRVAIGCLDPNPAVNGEGVRQLRAAGITVNTGICEGEARHLIAPFVARTVLGRPFVTVKWAEDTAGHIAGPAGARRQISGPAATRIVHELRALLGRGGAIVVGGQTLRQDDPLLTARPPAPNDPATQPRRIVLTRTGQVPASARLFHSPGGKVEVLRVGPEGLRPLLQALWSDGVWEVLVESGGQLAAALAAEGLVDRYWILRSKHLRLEPGSLRATALPDPAHVAFGATLDLGDDQLIEAWDRRSGTFACTAPSADLVRLRDAQSPTP